MEHTHALACNVIQAKHKERFAIRAKYMTLDARVNKYIQYFKNIRVISQHLCRQATKYAVRDSTQSMVVGVAHHLLARA
jgi:2-phosphoglycerate kinase